jgi:hypothetical protein
MVAIHNPSAEHDWFPAPTLPGIDPYPAPRPSDVPRRRLPDRATRIRRRRLAALLLALAVSAAAWTAGQALVSLTQAGSTAPQPVELRDVPQAGQRYVVRPGDTLWSIAEEVAPDRDPRQVVDALVAANGDATLEVGDVLTLDVG